MTMFLAPYTAIADIDGSPLDAGFLFFGEYGKDPELFPVEVFWDADFTVPAAQPIRTRNGYPVRNGSPTKVYLKTAEHSIAIKNRNSAFILVDFFNKGWDASFVVDGDKTQKQINDAQLSLNNILKSNRYLDVRLLGVIPDSILDQGVKINSADAIARSAGKGLYFPSGTYLATGLLPSVSWIGDGKDSTLIKNSGADSFNGFLDFKNNVRAALYQDIRFSGGVNADPEGSWEGIFNTWFSGACAFVATNSKNVLFNRCSLRDSKLAPLRIWSGCRNIVMLDCDMSHSRGNFGDGVYIQNSQNVYGDRVSISDVTRIGVVFEGNTKNCVFKNSSVEYAHHQSRFLGGIEFNGGFWAENSANIFLEDCKTLNTGEYGFLMTTGNALKDVDVAHFGMTQCTADGNNIGFLIRSKQDSVTVRHTLKNCRALNSKVRPFFLQARYDTDEFLLMDCFAEVRGDLSTSPSDIISGIMASSEFTYTNKRAKITVSNLTLKHVAVDIASYKDESVYPADITFYGGAAFDCTFDNVRNMDSTIPVYIKNRLAIADVQDKMIIKNGKYFFPRLRSTGRVQIENADILGGNILSTGKVRINNSPVKALFFVSSDDLRVNDCDMDFSTAADFFSYSTATSTNKITAKFNNCNFNKDITANDYSLKLQMDGANKAKVLINGSEFYNLSAATTTANTHIWIVRSPASVIYQNVIRDSTAHLQKVNTSVSTTEPVGSTPLTLH